MGSDAQGVLLAGVAILVLLAIAIALFVGFLGASNAAAKDGAASAKPAGAVAAQATTSTGASTSRTTARSRMRGVAARRRQEEEAREDQSGSGEDSEEDEGGEDRANMSKKERNKAEKREQREARRVAEEAKEDKAGGYADRRKAKDEKLDAQRKTQEEEMQRAAEERKTKENEEAAQWMGQISVEQEGTGEGDDQTESQGLLQQFIDYIKTRKTVPLEQLATEFKLRTTDVIDRVQGLEAMGRLTGVMDERGKYIYISPDEMQAVAKYINEKGRVAISELAAKSNTFIDLEAKQTDVSIGATPAIDFDSLLETEGGPSEQQKKMLLKK